MVVIHIKNSEHDSFLYETTCDTSNDALIRDLVEVWNLRIRLRQLVGALIELGNHGPMKPPDKAGLDSIDEECGGSTVFKAEHYKADPTGARTGNGPGPQYLATMVKVAADAEAAISKVAIERKVVTSLALLQDKLDNIRGSVMMGECDGHPRPSAPLSISNISIPISSFLTSPCKFFLGKKNYSLPHGPARVGHSASDD